VFGYTSPFGSASFECGLATSAEVAARQNLSRNLGRFMHHVIACEICQQKAVGKPRGCWIPTERR
jgi:hypothetical protein